MYLLMLNNMAHRMEEMTTVAFAETKEEILTNIQKYICEPYNETDEYNRTWYKTFKKSSPFEWYNKPENIEEHIVEVMSLPVVLERTTEAYNRDMAEIRRTTVNLSNTLFTGVQNEN